ncbi:MarR family winged helix-turn-helix transcriptional regulator [Blastococcus sp. LR1]|uniref:MarR family winged helix-turn-helix transcriptional regulator n=1 Tax=Blastococcus sp. LR1 TaxID=2877000 RepID=UPI001CCCA3EF|nr:MarR family winged helix-turn-helix transcriptional regulator [Blastococcus sp. LR1]MCA0146631.1 MarR family winged helix-turn-helix transcriptional regulator [Blastococcus sp. LR1]
MPQGARWLDDDEQAAWQTYRRMARQVEASLARALVRDAGLSMQDYDVLSSLTDSAPTDVALTGTAEHRVCLKDLAADLTWSPSRLSHHLDRMQARGLVRRVVCREGRGTDVEATEQGLAAVAEAAPGHVAAVRAVFVDVISRKDLATLGRIGDAVLENLAETEG